MGKWARLPGGSGIWIVLEKMVRFLQGENTQRWKGKSILGADTNLNKDVEMVKYKAGWGK